MPPTVQQFWIGCAGWSIPREHAERFPAAGTHLERYAQRLPAVEINTSFYRPHQPATYARWAASTPEEFQFAVKVPREITHARRLLDVAEPLDRFLAETAALGRKLGPLLVQLPPSLRFDEPIAAAFFAALRARFGGQVVCEPRHPTWFGEAPARVLVKAQVARVAADPAPVPEAARPGGWPGLVYYRLPARPRCTSPATPAATSRRSPRHCAPAPRRPGVSSTTPPSARRPTTRLSCASCSPARPLRPRPGARRGRILASAKVLADHLRLNLHATCED